MVKDSKRPPPVNCATAVPFQFADRNDVGEGEATAQIHGHIKIVDGVPMFVFDTAKLWLGAVGSSISPGRRYLITVAEQE